jgi:hypothetical protein
MWREIKNSDMNSSKMRFYDAADAIRTYVELQTTMSCASGYDYSNATTSETTGQTFGLDEYITLKSVLQEASRDMDYSLWVMLVSNVINDQSVRSLEAENPGARKKLAVAKRMVEQCLRKRDMLMVKPSGADAAGEKQG